MQHIKMLEDPASPDLESDDLDLVSTDSKEEEVNEDDEREDEHASDQVSLWLFLLLIIMWTKHSRQRAESK